MVILLMNIWHDNFLSDDESRKMWIQVMKHYLEIGVDVSAEADSWYTAVLSALPDYEILELLISYGADINHRNYGGLTALMEAYVIDTPIPLDTRSCARLLLENGADPNAVCNAGHNALVYAVEHSCPNIADIRLLFEYNVDMDVSYMFSMSYTIGLCISHYSTLCMTMRILKLQNFVCSMVSI